MKRILFTVVCLLIVLPAVPSFADSSVSGFYRSRFMMNNYAFGDDRKPDKLVDTRARVKWSHNVDEYLTFVYYGEIDFIYGDQAYATSRNKGGGASADSVNLETKNVYVQAKLPDTPLTATIGLQGYVDHNDLALLLGDMAGVRVGWAAGQVRGNVAWFKMSEGNTQYEDDATLYAAQVVFDPSKELSITGGLYWADMQGSTPQPGSKTTSTVTLPEDVEPGDTLPVDTTTTPTYGSAVYAPYKSDMYYATARATYKMDMATIQGWLLYAGGTVYGASDSGADLNAGGFAAAANAKFSFAGAKATVYGIFFSSDDDATDKDHSAVFIPWASNTAPVGMAVPFAGAGMMMMMSDPFGTTVHTGYGLAMKDGAYSAEGYGLMALTGKVEYTPPEMKNLWASFAAGYFTALEDAPKGADKKEGKSMGVETVARVGYKFGKLDLSLNGGYVFLGDFYDKALGGKDPDNLYEVYAMANVNF